MKTKAFLNSFKKNYMVGVRPSPADCSHVDNVYIKAFSRQDAMNRVDMEIDHLGYIVKDVIAPGDEIYGNDELCTCGRKPLPKWKFS